MTFQARQNRRPELFKIISLYINMAISSDRKMVVTKTRNGEWGMGNGEREIENGKIKKSKNWKKYELFLLYK